MRSTLLAFRLLRQWFTAEPTRWGTANCLYFFLLSPLLSKLLKVEDADDRLQVITGVVEAISADQAKLGQQPDVIGGDLPIGTWHFGMEQVGKVFRPDYEPSHTIDLLQALNFTPCSGAFATSWMPI